MRYDAVEAASFPDHPKALAPFKPSNNKRLYLAKLRDLLYNIRCVHEEARSRSEEHTSELQSRSDLVCRLLLEKKNIIVTSPEVVEVARICDFGYARHIW